VRAFSMIGDAAILREVRRAVMISIALPHAAASEGTMRLVVSNLMSFCEIRRYMDLRV